MWREVSGRRDSNSRLTAWKAVALPTELLPRLGNDLVKSSKCNKTVNDANRLLPLLLIFATKNIGKMWEQMDSNHRRCNQQIYSLPHLAALEYSQSLQKWRASGETRTPDQLITNQLLYQLSYTGLIWAAFQKRKYLEWTSFCDILYLKLLPSKVCFKKRCKDRFIKQTSKFSGRNFKKKFSNWVCKLIKIAFKVLTVN